MKRIAIMLLAVGTTSCSSHPITGTLEPSAAGAECAKQQGPYRWEEGDPPHFDTAAAILFEREGHLFTTVSAARELGLNFDRSMMLAYYSQYPDIDPDFDALHVAIRRFLVQVDADWRDGVNGALHSLHGGSNSQVEARREKVRLLLARTLKDSELDWLSGLLIHAFGDSYAHTKGVPGDEEAYGPRFGHAWHTITCRSPDDICRGAVQPKYRAYDTALRSALREGFGSKHVGEHDSGIEASCRAGKHDFVAPKIECPVSTPREGPNGFVPSYVCCMNASARALTRAEIQRAIDLIRCFRPIPDIRWRPPGLQTTMHS